MWRTIETDAPQTYFPLLNTVSDGRAGVTREHGDSFRDTHDLEFGSVGLQKLGAAHRAFLPVFRTT